MKIYKVMDSPVCLLNIACDGEAITDITFKSAPATAVLGNSPVLDNAVKQLEEYFNGSRKVFELPLSFSGTDFQNRVWHALCKIPYGETMSYGDIARLIGSPMAFRAVGMANNKNRIPIIIPCHRVIGADGGLTGYAGGVDIKKFLLALEAHHK